MLKTKHNCPNPEIGFHVPREAWIGMVPVCRFA